MSKKPVFLSLPDLKKAREKGEGTKVRQYKDDRPIDLELLRGKSFFIRTYGCQGNIRDEETMAGLLSSFGMLETDDSDKANLVILNTCAVRENAEEKVYGEIGRYKKRHEEEEDFMLCIAGCMMQEESKAEKLTSMYPQVSLIIGTHNIASLPYLISRYLEEKIPLVEVFSFSGEVLEGLPVKRNDPYKAYVDISYGCDKFCTYCIVPYTRGRERSRPSSEIIKEIKTLYEEGYQEVTLLGQNVNSYGKDNGDVDFAGLLDMVAEIPIPRIRFLTSHPFDFNHEMVEAIGRHKNIMKWIHLPFQAGSDRILRLMGRRYNKKQYLELVEDIRKTIPGVALSTDIIVGFPGENEEDFLDTIDVVEKVGFESAYTFIYSPRAGTPAARMEDGVSPETKHERFVRLTKAVEKSVEKSSDSMVGNTYEVLVDGPSKRDETVLSGYTESNKLVNFKGPSYLKGCIVPVLIKESHAYSLFGELVGDPLVHKAKMVGELLKRDPAVSEYGKIEKAIGNCKDIQDLIKALPDLKKKAAKAFGSKEGDKAKEEYEEALKTLNEHPLIKNKETLEPFVNGLLKEAEGIIG